MNTTDKLNKLCKWRSVLAGRIWGTAVKSPQTRGRSDIFEKLLIQRVEMSALTKLLLDKGVFTSEEFDMAVGDEAVLLDADYEKQFPGITTDLDGVHYRLPEAMKTMEGWPP